MKPALFIDRDGTLNEMVYDETHGLLDSPRRPEQVRMIAGAGRFLREVRGLGYLIIVATNQPGIAKGTLTVEELEAVNARLKAQLENEGGRWDDLFYCPHHPAGDTIARPEFAVACKCRKPMPGMLLEAARKWAIDLPRSWMIGDGLNDIECGQSAGVRTALVTQLKIEHIERFLAWKQGPPTRIAGTLETLLPDLQESISGSLVLT
jgi:D-glycero-D-manno-heptose 1,7-bisphosphate phosphatase